MQLYLGNPAYNHALDSSYKLCVLSVVQNYHVYKAPAAPRQRFALEHPSPTLSSVGHYVYQGSLGPKCIP